MNSSETRVTPGIGWHVLGMWTLAWLVAQVLLVAFVNLAGAESDGPVTVPMLTLAAVTQWSVFIAAIAAVDRWAARSELIPAVRVSFRARDLIGLPIGIITQLVAVPLLYVPLRWAWPGVFSDERLKERATDTASSASGWNVAVLILIIAVGAPIVEEMVYRGFIQRNIRTRLSEISTWLFVAAWFTLIHFAPVEYPGLFLFSLIVGAAGLRSRRLGLPILIHVGFNATALVLTL